MPRRNTCKLTNLIMERMKAEGKGAIFWDCDLAGFGVSDHTTGHKLYTVQSRGPARSELRVRQYRQRRRLQC